MWLKLAKKQALALRKTNLRVDLRVYASDPAITSDPSQSMGMVDSLLHSAIMRGLDVIGVVSPDTPDVGWKAQALAKQKNLDLAVIPGEDYSTSDGMKLMVYLLKQPMPLNLDSEQAIEYAHSQRGFVMACNLSKRFAHKLEKFRGTPSAPDAIELYNAVSGAFHDIEIPQGYPLFITSGAVNPTKLEQMKTFTVIPRQDIEGMGLLGEGHGMEYTPSYLLPKGPDGMPVSEMPPVEVETPASPNMIP